MAKLFYTDINPFYLFIGHIMGETNSEILSVLMDHFKLGNKATEGVSNIQKVEGDDK